MELVIDVGNTETVLGIVDPGTLDLRAHWRLSTTIPRTPDEYGLLLRSLLRDGGIPHDDLTMAVLGSVVPLRREFSRIRSSASWERHRSWWTRGARCRFGWTSMNRSRSAPIASSTHSRPRRCMDGTPSPSISDRHHVRLHHGRRRIRRGVIAQGLQSGLEWLGSKTAKLPRVELTPPETVIGRRTEACIQSGVFFSAVDAVDGIVRRILDEWQREDVYVVATGGTPPRRSLRPDRRPHRTLPHPLRPRPRGKDDSGVAGQKRPSRTAVQCR